MCKFIDIFPLPRMGPAIDRDTLNTFGFDRSHETIRHRNAAISTHRQRRPPIVNGAPKGLAGELNSSLRR